jgi:competence ComEA-like helix-hairpin-helix protein
MKTSHRFITAAGIALAVAATAIAADSPDASAGKKVNINQASAAQLAFLPRVGNKAAERIVEYRKAHGTFGQAEELMEVKGVGEKLFTELKPYVALSGPTTLTAKVRSGSPRSPRSASGKKVASNSVPVGKGR